MNLFLNTDANWKTGWRGFDVAINRNNTRQADRDRARHGARHEASIEVWSGGNWNIQSKTPRASQALFALRGHEIELAIPLRLLKIAKLSEIDFKWTDNTGGKSDALNWYSRGDTAPNGRFAYRYIVR